MPLGSHRGQVTAGTGEWSAVQSGGWGGQVLVGDLVSVDGVRWVLERRWSLVLG